jgi:hypothetical protein
MDRIGATVLLKKMLGPETEFRDGQWEAIDLVANRRQRVLVVQRTGWGKSVVYFLATKILRGAGAGPTLRRRGQQRPSNRRHLGRRGRGVERRLVPGAGARRQRRAARQQGIAQARRDRPTRRSTAGNFKPCGVGPAMRTGKGN